MSENLKFATQKLEPLILNNCILNPSYFLKFKKYLQTEKDKTYFNDKKYQMIFNILAKYYDRFQKLPVKETFEIITEKLSKDDLELKMYYTSIINNMYLKQEIDNDFLMEETAKFIKEARVYEALMNSQNLIEKQDFSKIVSEMEEAVRVNFDTDFGISIKEVGEVFRQIDLTENVKVVSSGYSAFDSIIGGGFKPKNLYVLSALPGYGKTLFKGNIALNMVLQGYKVVYYSMEMSVSQMMTRYYQNIINVSKTELIIHEEESKELLNKKLNLIEGDLILKEYNSNSVSSNDIMAHLRDLKTYENFIPDIVFVDYIMIMLPNSYNKDASMYEKYNDVAIELRNIGKEFDIPIVSSIQINREGMDDKGGTKSSVSSKALAGSRGVLDTADGLFIIGASKKEKEKNLFKLITDKNRHGPTDTIVNFEIDYDHMRINEKSVMN